MAHGQAEPMGARLDIQPRADGGTICALSVPD
jgi:hypothetical protein